MINPGISAAEAPPPEPAAKGSWAALVEFFLTLHRRRFVIMQMTGREIADQRLGSVLGLFWSLAHPVALIVVLWVVFSLGFRVSPAQGFPFVVWLSAGMVIWISFAESLQRSTHCITASPHLVKRLRFPLSILPVVQFFAASILHLIFLAVLGILILLHGLPLSLYWIQAVYYFIAMGFLVVGLGWLTAALNTLFRDVAQAVQIFLQFGFWATPIFWDLEMMPENLQFFFKLNPLFYIVQGYRESFLTFIPFWQHPWLTLYFWAGTAAIFAFGGIVFRRLRPHFPDLL